MNQYKEFYEKLESLDQSQLRQWIFSQYLGILRGPDYPNQIVSGDQVIKEIYEFLRTHLKDYNKLSIRFEQAVWDQAEKEMNATKPDPSWLESFISLFTEVTPSTAIRSDLINLLMIAVTTSRWKDLYVAYRNLHMVALELLITLEPGYIVQTEYTNSLADYFGGLLTESLPGLRHDMAGLGLNYLSTTNKPVEFFNLIARCFAYYAVSPEMHKVLVDNIIIHYNRYAAVNLKHLAAFYMYLEEEAAQSKKYVLSYVKKVGLNIAHDLLFDRIDTTFDDLDETYADSRWLVLLGVCLSSNRPHLLSPALVYQFFKNVPEDNSSLKGVSGHMWPFFKNTATNVDWDDIYVKAYWYVFDKLNALFKDVNLSSNEEAPFIWNVEEYYRPPEIILTASSHLNQLDKCFTNPHLREREITIPLDNIPYIIHQSLTYDSAPELM